MSRHIVLVALVCLTTLPAGLPATAGPIERACNSSPRDASRALCNCIQQVADLSLNKRDQRRAAGFFKTPHKAQETRQSDRASDEAFWLRYKKFGETAGRYCASVVS